MIRVVVPEASRPTSHNMDRSSLQTGTFDKTLDADTDIELVAWASEKHEDPPQITEEMDSGDREDQAAAEVEVEIPISDEDTGAQVKDDSGTL